MEELRQMGGREAVGDSEGMRKRGGSEGGR